MSWTTDAALSDAMIQRVCPQGHPMMILHQFRLAHEAADSAADTAHLRTLEALGVELGADVTVWYCVAV
jgi:hypothetical protein